MSSCAAARTRASARSARTDRRPMALATNLRTWVSPRTKSSSPVYMRRRRATFGPAPRRVASTASGGRHRHVLKHSPPRCCEGTGRHGGGLPSSALAAASEPPVVPRTSRAIASGPSSSKWRSRPSRGSCSLGGGQLPPLRPARREAETTAVPGGRFRPSRAPRPGTQDRIDQRDGEVGGEELVREPRLREGQGSPSRVGHLADIRFCFGHVVHICVGSRVRRSSMGSRVGRRRSHRTPRAGAGRPSTWWAERGSCLSRRESWRPG